MVISIVRLNCQRVNHPLFQEPMSEHKSWTHGYPAHASNATPDPACHPNRRDKLPDKCDESRHAMPEKSSALNLQKTFRNGGLKMWMARKPNLFRSENPLRHLQLFNLHLGSTFGSYLAIRHWQYKCQPFSERARS